MRIAIFTLLSTILALASSTVLAQYWTDFEGLNASPTGVVLTGQDGYYLPAGTQSVDFKVYTYMNNSLGFPPNADGSVRFAAGTGPADSFFARAQRDVSFAISDRWEFSFDVAVKYLGTLPTAQNVGSFSTQLFPNEATVILLARWVDVNTATNWNADIIWFDDAGNQLTEEIPDPHFQNLSKDEWYRWGCKFDLATNQVVEICVAYQSTGMTYTYFPTNRYLWGGAAAHRRPPVFACLRGPVADLNLPARRWRLTTSTFIHLVVVLPHRSPLSVVR